MENSLRVEDTDRKKKLVKYLLFGLVVAISIRYVSTNKVENKEILMISAISSITFGIVDMVSPSIVVNKV
jgi:xanthine/uracil permease